MARYTLKRLRRGLAAKIPDKRQLKDMGMVAAGGALGGLTYGVVLDNVGWFTTGTGSTAIMKRTGLAVGVALVGGSLLWQVQEEVAKGMIGAMGAVIGSTVASKVGLPVSLHGLGTTRVVMPSTYNQPFGRMRRPRRRLRGANVRENEYVFGGSPLSATLAAI